MKAKGAMKSKGFQGSSNFISKGYIEASSKGLTSSKYFPKIKEEVIR